MAKYNFTPSPFGKKRTAEATGADVVIDMQKNMFTQPSNEKEMK
jgi:hypothetical protein